MTAGTSQPTATVPPWNPQKQAAPTPPAGQESRVPASSQAQVGTSSGTNFPDVTAGIRDLYEVRQRNLAASDETASELSVVPDYPLDSLPRNASTRQTTESTGQASRTPPTRVPSDSRTAQTRVSQSSAVTRTSQSSSDARTSQTSSGPRTSGGARTSQTSGAVRTSSQSSTGLPSQSSAARTSQNSGGARPSQNSSAARTSHTSSGARTSQSGAGVRPNQRGSGHPIPTSAVSSSTIMTPSSALRPSGGEMPPSAGRTTRAITQQPVSHSNVRVSVNHPVALPHSAGDPRQIRTQDLQVGVVARLEQRGLSGNNVLPDLVAHSQPQGSGRPPTNLPRTAISSPVSDPRQGQSRRHHDSRSRPHQHRDQRYSRSHRTRRRSQSEDDPHCKDSCLKCVAVGTSFRWILVVLSLLGVCCVITGIILAALHAAGNSFLFLAIMFIGLGVLLVVVVGVGWKCTPRGHEPLHALFGIGEFRRHRSRRTRSHHRRDGRWHGGSTMYPEFQFPRPPPTYDASMRDYQNQQQLAVATPSPTTDLYDPDDTPLEDYSLPSSPPPSYRSRASTVRAGIQITFPPNQGGDFPDSRPPTYRSHPSNTLPGHGRTRPSLSRDDEDDDDIDVAPADVAFTGSSVVVDTNSNQTTSIQIDAAGAPNQNVTVSVTTVSVTTQSGAAFNTQPFQLVAAGNLLAQPNYGALAVADKPTDDDSEQIDPLGNVEGDSVNTAL